MSPALFILTICSYLVSMGGALIISFFSKLISTRFINSFLFLHFALLVGWILIPENSNRGFLFLAFFCTGIIAAGLLLRKKYAIGLKIYFSVFIASILVFLISPSRVIGFVSSGSLETINPGRIHISENFFFVEQERNNATTSKDSAVYKLVKEMGVFHKTLAREIILPSKTDSVRLLNTFENKEIQIRIYSSNTITTDSTDLIIKTGTVRDSSDVITRKVQIK